MDDACILRDLIPIALLNFSLKIVAKQMINRLQTSSWRVFMRNNMASSSVGQPRTACNGPLSTLTMSLMLDLAKYFTKLTQDFFYLCCMSWLLLFSNHRLMMQHPSAIYIDHCLFNVQLIFRSFIIHTTSWSLIHH